MPGISYPPMSLMPPTLLYGKALSFKIWLIRNGNGRVDPFHCPEMWLGGENGSVGRVMADSANLVVFVLTRPSHNQRPLTPSKQRFDIF